MTPTVFARDVANDHAETVVIDKKKVEEVAADRTLPGAEGSANQRAQGELGVEGAGIGGEVIDDFGDGTEKPTQEA